MEKEYEFLRSEVLQRMDRQINLITILYTAIGALLVYILPANNPLLFVIPYVVLLPLTLRMRSNLDCMSRLSSYLIVFLETEVAELNWETNNLLRGEINRKNRKTHASIFSSTIFINCFISVMCYVFFLIALANAFSIINLIVGGTFCASFTIIISIISIKTILNEKTIKTKYIEEWQQVKTLSKKQRQDMIADIVNQQLAR